jgi:hypothetical protein
MVISMNHHPATRLPSGQLLGLSPEYNAALDLLLDELDEAELVDS